MDTAALAVIVMGLVVVLVGIILGYQQLSQIHAAVNSNMTTALNKIDELHGKLAAVEENLRHEKTRTKRAAPKRKSR